MPEWFEGFEAAYHDVNGVTLFARHGGNGPPLLLLHGFPQTHAIWHRVAQQLAEHFFLVMPDLRGYGDSAKPADAAAHASYSKRAMAADVLALMQELGHRRFAVAGHDRGGRVAHRLALDHPDAVTRLCLIDIAPTLDMYEATDMAFARHYYHWFHLIQPAPLPERMIGGNARFYLHWVLGSLGSLGSLGPAQLSFVESQALEEYERCFCTAEGIHGACEDYRASAGIDLDHDRASREAGEKITSDLHVLWGGRCVIHKLFDLPTLWRAQCAGALSHRVLPAGHFIPEELPQAIAQEFLAFFLDRAP
jgi:haloacetate dehalogenase